MSRVRIPGRSESQVRAKEPQGRFQAHSLRDLDVWCPGDLTGAFGHFSSCLEAFLDSAATKLCYCLNLALLVLKENVISPAVQGVL